MKYKILPKPVATPAAKPTDPKTPAKPADPKTPAKPADPKTPAKPAPKAGA